MEKECKKSRDTFPFLNTIFTFRRTFLIGFSVFKNEPASPANRAQGQRSASRELGQANSYVTSVKNLLTNRGYVLLLFTYGINVGVFYAISTLLSTTVVQHFEV